MHFHCDQRSRREATLIFCGGIPVSLGDLADLANAALAAYQLAPDIAQLLDGWHADGTYWSEWDELVRNRLMDVQQQLELVRKLTGEGK
ncbi:MAG: hypothetical protein KGL39_20515 [Patescibacteria group bacterium]|nr:hypothetical protein [Patescibacteria group bacterium]